MRSLTRFQGCERISRTGSPAILGTALGLAMFGGPAAHAQLIITPTFDSSITGSTNAAAIEATINQAISVYQTTFTDPINVTIQFGEMNTGLGQSNTWYYKLGYSTVRAAMVADATSADDATALAHLAGGANNPVNGTSTINIKTANIRALNIAGSFPSGLTGGFDGIIGLNTTITDVGNTGTTGQYSLLATTEHEIDEVLGLGSDVNGGGGFFSDPAMQDLYRYTPAGARSFGLGTNNAYFSIDGTTDIVQYNNQNNGGDTGDWQSNPRPVGVNPQVQDAFATPGGTPTLGPSEIRSLDVIGYTLNATPEPSAVAMFGAGALAFAGYGVRRRKRSRKTAA